MPPGTARYILAVGTVEPRKDYPGLVRAFGAVADARPDVALVIAGADGWGADLVSRGGGRLTVARRIVPLGYVADDALERWMVGAELLAFPSVYEGFGFPPLEAMDCGVPVVATTAGAVPEIVGEAAVLVAPATPTRWRGRSLRCSTTPSSGAPSSRKGGATWRASRGRRAGPD